MSYQATSKKRKEQDYYMQKILELVTKKELAFELAKKFSRLSTDADDDDEKNRKIERKRDVWSYKTEDLTQFIKDEMNGTDAKLVIQKLLDYNDIKEDQEGLNMPIEQLETQDFLTTRDKKDLEEGKRKIVVRLVGPRLQMYEQPMVLSQSTNSYELKANWKHFVKVNKDDLKENSKIQVWSFRRDEQLCFALLVVEKPCESVMQTN